MLLNSSQRQALDLKRHTALTASAGSGKTSVLVERFLQTLRETDWDPSRIVAITFTEEAAAEMRSRIQQRLSDLAAEARTEEPAASHKQQWSGESGWEKATQDLWRSRISTIHGFCLSLLKDYPIEIGLSPDFTVLSATEQDSLLWQKLTTILRRLAASNHPALKTLLLYVSRSKLESLLLEMIRRRNYLDIASFTLQRGPLEVLFQEETARILSRIPETTRLESILDSLPEDLLEDSNSYSKRCNLQRQAFSLRDLDRPVEFIRELEKTFTQRASPTARWKTLSQYEELRAVWAGLRNELRRHPMQYDSPPPEADRHYHCALAALVELYHEGLAAYEEGKKELSALDFEDLLAKARDLVRIPGLAEAIRSRYSHFLVDEFQDTNALQWDIIRPLVETRGGLFIVGDSKQSIYRFRDADVTIFGRARKWMSGQGVQVSMPENYRSLPALVKFNNLLFSSLLRGDLPYEAEHQEMLPKRLEEGAGKVEVCFWAPNSEAHPEPLVVAEWIHRLRRAGRSPGEIAVLLRTRTRLSEYEGALTRYGIPFRTIGGAGFYERQEVLDLIHLIGFLSNPHDDVALAGVLKSPLFNLSDEALFLLSLSEGRSLWIRMGRTCSGQQAPRVNSWGEARRILGSWLQVQKERTVSEILHLAIEHTGYLPILRESLRGGQCLANVDKLLEILRQFEIGRRKSSRECAQFLENLIASETTEPESLDTGTLGDAVRIYTIHGAKGLQFPVVILPELGNPFSRGPSDRFFNLSIPSGKNIHTYLGLKILNPEDKYSEIAHPIYEMLRQLDGYRQLAEEKRLLYVATTRAQDHLILIGQESTEESHSRWLRDAGIEHLRVDVPTPDKLAGSADYSLPAELEPTNQMPPLAGTEFAVSGNLTSGHLWSVENRIWTPTDIALYHRCARRYYLTRIAAYPPNATLSLEPAGGKAALIGSAVHEILEKFWPLEDHAGIDEYIQRLNIHRIQPFYPEERETIVEDIYHHIRTVSKSPFTQRIRLAPVVRSEQSFRVSSQGRLLTGIIDKCFRESSGAWVVADFKTNRLKSEEIESRVGEERYDLQLEFYLWAVSRILSADSVKGFLFFTATGDLWELPRTNDRLIACETVLASLPERMDRENFPRTRDTTQCRSCDFRGRVCPGAAEGQLALWS